MDADLDLDALADDGAQVLENGGDRVLCARVSSDHRQYERDGAHLK